MTERTPQASAQMALALADTRPPQVTLSPGATLLRGFALSQAEQLLATIHSLGTLAAFRYMQTPGGGQMSAALTNCGALGWVTDSTGYRYTSRDPQTNVPWPAMPALFQKLAFTAALAAGYKNFHPNACLLNRYAPASGMGLHQDKDEGNITQPIVSVSLGLPIIFLWGGLKRTTKPFSIMLEHGDVVVWGHKSRLHFHGVKPLAKGVHPLTGACRFNLTFRSVTPQP